MLHDGVTGSLRYVEGTSSRITWPSNSRLALRVLHCVSLDYGHLRAARVWTCHPSSQSTMIIKCYVTGAILVLVQTSALMFMSVETPHSTAQFWIAQRVCSEVVVRPHLHGLSLAS